jgi:DNA-binding CsgD family transcriptional regulator
VGGLFGREIDLAAVAAFRDDALRDGGALLITGEPGVGKTALLDEVARGTAADRPDVTVIRGTGTQYQAEISFADLHQLLLPLSGLVGELPAPAQAGLTALFGPATDMGVGRLLVSTAVLTLLRRAAQDRPLLLVIDDLPWFDRASGMALGFVARRLAESRVALLATARTGSFEGAGIPSRELRPLTDAPAVALLRTAYPALGAETRRWVLAAARGNPLALHELAADPSAGTRGATRLADLFADRVRDLPGETGRLLLLAALDGTGDLRLLRAAAGPPGLEVLTAAEQARLIEVSGGNARLRFLHPLGQAAVVRMSSADQRRQAHRDLAAQLTGQPERQAWHLAEAAAGPDEPAAVLLEQVAYQIMRRGDAAGAVAAFLRAADLSPDPAGRDRRMMRAAFVGAGIAGGGDPAAYLRDRTGPADPLSGAAMWAAVASAFLMLTGDGTAQIAHQVLVGLIEARARAGRAVDDALQQALFALLLVCWFGGRTKMWTPFYAAIEHWADDVSDDLLLLARTYADPARVTPAVLADLDAAVAGLGAEPDLLRVLTIASACIYTDRLAGVRAALQRVYAEARTGGAMTPAVTALAHLVLDHILAGRWDEAARLAGDGAELCRDGDVPLQAWVLLHRRALLAALRGDDNTEELVGEILGWAHPRGMDQGEIAALHVRTVAALGRSDFAEAYRHAAAISPPGELASHVAYALWVPLDLVEAAVRTGRRPEAVAHLAALDAAGVGRISDRLALLCAAGHAVVAPDDDAAAAFARALSIPDVDRWPFDVARVRLLAGERLRQLRDTAGACRYLTAAAEAFRQLGAAPWATRATAALRASGQATAGVVRQPLSAKEEHIAALAAAGLTNKQIGQRLFLSPRTVGSHLYRIFPKLGVTTRAALRDVIPPTDGLLG